MFTFFLDLFTHLYAIVNWFFGLTGAYWGGLILMVAAYFLGFMDFVLDFFCDYIVLCLDVVSSTLEAYDLSLPNPAGTQIDVIADYSTIANYYFPLLEGGFGVATFVLLATAVWTVRFFIKLIPTVG